jgi:hypothetical protein
MTVVSKEFAPNANSENIAMAITISSKVKPR